MPLVLRAVKGSDLTPAEADGNFTFLDGRITTIEGLPLGVTITNVTMSGYTMTITMSDSSVYVVQFPQPDFTQMWAGAWQASTSYTAGQILSAYPPSGLYGVLQDHLSATSFDAGETNTAGDVYALLLAVPAVATYFFAGSTFTPGLPYANSYTRMINAAGCVITLPADGDVDFPVNTELHFRDASLAGSLTFEAPTSVTINSVDGYQNQSAGRGATVTLKKVAPNEWDILGLLAPGTA